ncbi:MAG: putative Ig domain-containing protein, partial [Oceanipulchritudo sp.]
QYDNSNNTARDALFFIDNYFNKTDPASTFAGTPRPPAWFLFGGGAATYYASEDRIGVVADHPLTTAIGTFEDPVLTDGEAAVAPGGSPWSFSGTAGIHRQAARQPATVDTLGSAITVADSLPLRGWRFRTGSGPVAVYAVGRRVLAGNDDSHTVTIYRDNGDGTYSSVLSLTVDLAGASEGTTVWERAGRNIFYISNKFYSTPAILDPDTTYILVSGEGSSGDTHADDSSVLTPPAGISILGSARGSADGSTWTFGGTANRGFGAVNLQISAQTVRNGAGSVDLGFTHDSRIALDDNRVSEESQYSPQAAFISGTGTAETAVTIGEAGLYALVYGLGQRPGLMNKLAIDLVAPDSSVISIGPRDQQDLRPSTTGWNHEGYWVKPQSGYDFYGSAPFLVEAPGTYTIRFRGTSSDAAATVFIDNVMLADSAVMTAGEIPAGGGAAEGAPDVSNWEARVMSMYTYAQAFGLRAVAYEGGWYPGGDANKMPLQFASSFFDPAVLAGEINAMEALARAGMHTNTDYTFSFAMPDHAMAEFDDYVRMQAWSEVAGGLPAEVTNGLPVNSTFTADSRWWGKDVDGATVPAGGWISWNVIVAETGTYDFSIKTTGSGSLKLLVDDAHAVIAGSVGSELTGAEGVFLTKGLHSLRLIAGHDVGAEGLTLDYITCALPGQAPGLAGLTAFGANHKVIAQWPPVPDADGYHVYYKTRLESEWTRYGGLTGFAGVPFAITGLDNDTTYNVVVTHVVGGVESAFSNMAAAATTASSPLLLWDFANDDSARQSSASTNNDLFVESAVMEMVGLTATSNGHYSPDAMTTGYPTEVYDYLDPSRHFTFAVDPVDNSTMNLTSLDLGVFGSAIDSDLFSMSVVVRWSTDGFTSWEELTPGPNPITSRSNGNWNTGTVSSVDLSGISALQGLDQPVSFRIYLFGTSIGVYHGLGKIGEETDDKPDVILWGDTVAAPLVITTTSLPALPLDQPVDLQLESTAAGAALWSLVNGSLPVGLELTSDGRLQGTPTESATLPITVQVETADGQSAFKSYSLVLGEGSGGFDTWAQQISDPLLRGALVDADLDGYVNLMEYALGMDPAISGDFGRIPQLQQTGNQLSLHYFRDASLADIIYIVEASGNLQSWTEIDSTDGQSFATGWATVTDPVNLTTEAPRFLRLRIQMR